MSAKNMRLSLFFSFFFFHFSFVSALDFGMFLNQEAGYGGVGSDGNFDYSIGAVPRLTGLFGQTGDFIVSVGIEVDYNSRPDQDGWKFVPELLRTEISFRPGEWAFEFGRIYHSDPLGFVAAGLFDGARAAYYSEAGTFSAGVWYAGLLYKRRVNIEMTSEETGANNAPLDYGNFADTYFAPRRILAALAWEHLGWPLKARASILAQFDLSGGKSLNSQYAVFNLTMPVNDFSFNLGGCLELIENDGKTEAAFAAEAAASYVLPGGIKSRLSFLARYSSGAFTPFTTENQGNILEAKLSGLSIISLDYVARLHPAFSAGLAYSYFIRTDLEAYNGYPLSRSNSSGYFLGNEFFARLLWSPASDLQINLGGGLFVPSMGDAAPDAAVLWRVELNAVFSLF